VSLEALEIVAEHLHEAPGEFGEFGLAAPGLDRFETMRLDAGRLPLHGEAEVRIGADIRALQRAVDTRRRVARIGMRLAAPNLPPVQPVLTSQQSTW
jgi:hypothetical protein